MSEPQLEMLLGATRVQRGRHPATTRPVARSRKRWSVQDTMMSAADEHEAYILSEARKIMERRLERGEAMTDPSRAGEYFKLRLRSSPHEVFACLFLDNRHRAIAFEELSRGTIDGAEVYPREVIKRCLANNCAALIVGHNHPSGSLEPSASDRAVTLRLRDALSLVEIRLVDHFVIGDGPPVSLAARGWV
jgi:DNA repair protein RadC